MLELKNSKLVFSAPSVHPEAKLTISFLRTLRIPDDNKEYPLPPSLGDFPLQMVDDYKATVPKTWLEHGGVMMPMFQSEALWLSFATSHVDRRGSYPFAIKVATGKVSAVTGDEWENGLKAKDYMVAPKQPWLDGYVVENGVIRQFVAAPLGSGHSVEQQITGKDEHGGIQIEVFPMKWEAFARRFPKAKPNPTRMRHSFRSNGLLGSYNPPGVFSYTQFGASPAYSADSLGVMDCDMERSDSMSLAAGGKMKQQIFDDPYDINDWDTSNSIRCFVHLANSLVWRSITQSDPPHPPLTAAEYTRQGFPWFDYYGSDPSVSATAKLGGIKSVKEIDAGKGSSILPENQSVWFKNEQVKNVGPEVRPDEVRQGSW